MVAFSSKDKESIEEMFKRPDKKQEIGFALSSFYILLFGMWGSIQFYAVTVLLIPLFFIPIMYLIYSIVDGFNDPLIGYYTDRSKRFTEKYGKRYLWIIIGSIATPIPLILAFIPISNSVVIAVIWLTVMMCLFETFATLREISQEALFPDLFRYEDQRSKVLGIGMFFTLVAQLTAAISIPLIIASLGGATETIAFIGAAIFIIVLIYIVSIPYIIWGVKESEEMKQLRLKLDQEAREYEPVKKVVKRIFKDRNWMGLIIAFLIWGTGGLCFIGGTNYFVLHYLGLGIEVMVLPGLLLIATAVASIPFWVKLSRKISAKNMNIIGMSSSAIGFFAFFFVEDYTGYVIMSAFMGVVWSGNWGIVNKLAQAQAIDNAAVKTGKREEASYAGIFRVFSAFTYFFQSLIFFIVWTLTGYVPEKRANQTELARLGLKLNISLIPATLAVVAIIIFTVMYIINKDTAILNKKKLAEMGL
jgi:GPH family glycoside/pentoside/hexuronide:cation symporter